MTMVRRWAAFGGLLLLSACAQGPDYVAPAAPQTSSYAGKGELPADLKLSGDQHLALGKAVAADWWTLFHDETLNGVVSMALSGNNDIKAAEARVKAAEEDIRTAKAAGLPQVSLAATAGRQKYGVALFGPSDFHIPPFTYYSVGPTATLPLDIFGGTARAVEARTAYHAMQVEQLRGAYQSLSANVVAQALHVASARDRIAALNRIVADDERNVDLVEKAIKAGAGTRTELLSAQSQLAADRTLLPDLMQEESVARHALSVLVGEAPADWAVPDFDLSGMMLPGEVAVRLPSELAKARPDIAAAEAKLHMASAEIGVATANLYPHIELSANTTQQALTPGNLFKSVANAWAIAANLTQPLFEGGRLKAERRAAVDQYQAALAEYRQAVLVAFGQVADDLAALKNDADKERAQRAAADTAASALALARRSFEIGNSGILDVIDAERRSAEAQLGLSMARAQRYLDLVHLYWALGGSLPEAVQNPAPVTASAG